MFSLILLVLLALIFGYFATQNTQQISVTILNQSIPGLPLYIAIGLTLLIGFGVCWIISLSDTFSKVMKLRGKNNTIKDGNKTIDNLNKKVNQLELEKAQIEGELKEARKSTS